MVWPLIAAAVGRVALTAGAEAAAGGAAGGTAAGGAAAAGTGAAASSGGAAATAAGGGARLLSAAQFGMGARSGFKSGAGDGPNPAESIAPQTDSGTGTGWMR